MQPETKVLVNKVKAVIDSMQECRRYNTVVTESILVNWAYVLTKGLLAVEEDDATGD